MNEKYSFKKKRNQRTRLTNHELISWWVQKWTFCSFQTKSKLHFFPQFVFDILFLNSSFRRNENIVVWSIEVLSCLKRTVAMIVPAIPPNSTGRRPILSERVPHQKLNSFSIQKSLSLSYSEISTNQVEFEDTHLRIEQKPMNLSTFLNSIQFLIHSLSVKSIVTHYKETQDLFSFVWHQWKLLKKLYQSKVKN